MGATGTGLFSDDVAKDVRDEWVETFRKTQSAAKASERVLRAFRSDLKDSDDGPVVRIALAVMQHKYGRLTAWAKRDAIRVIAQGQGLDRWSEAGAKQLTKRRAIYADLAKLLNSPQPAPRTPKKASRPKGHPFKPGDVVSVPISTTRVGYIKILETDRDARFADIALVDFASRPGRHPENWSGLPLRWIRHKHTSGKYKGLIRGDACWSVCAWDDRAVPHNEMVVVGNVPVTLAERRMVARSARGTGSWSSVPPYVKLAFRLKEPDFQLFIRKPGPIRPGQLPTDTP